MTARRSRGQRDPQESRPHTRWRPALRKTALGLTALAAAGVVALSLVWTFQRSLIYFPDRSAVPPAGEVVGGAVDLTLHTEDGLELGAWFVPSESAELAVLIAPGNGANRQARAGLAEALQEAGFAVLLMDYRGYGGNPGRPTETGLLWDALAASDALASEGFPPERTIYMGESLGGGVVAALMGHRVPAGVVLRSPFTELADVARHHYPWLPVRALLRDEFPVATKVAASQVPVAVIRAREDSVIPTELSAEVAAAAGNLHEELVLDNLDHNDPEMFGGEVVGVVLRLAESVSESQSP